jgi:hypothetical protein
MNLKRGFVRLWIVASLLWIAAFIWYLRASCSYSADDVLDCWTGDEDWMMPISYFSIRDYARLGMIGASVPLGLLFFGYVIAWVAKGFRSPHSK